MCLIGMPAAGLGQLRRVLPSLGTTLILGLVLLVACGDPSESAQPSVARTPPVQQPVLRPRPVATTIPMAPASAAAAASETAAATGGPEFVQVATGENHTCALRRTGQAVCWGPNDQGQMDVPADVQFRQISSGWRFTCGIQLDGHLTCWGRNNHQQADPPEGRFTAIDAGWDHACGLSGTTAICWGRNANGRASPPAGGEFTAIGAGAEHSCGLTANGDLECWGKNDDGRANSLAGPFRALAVGIAHTCVLTQDATAYCQGANVESQTTPRHTSFAEISAGSDHTCGTLTTGLVECWGGKQSDGSFASFAPAGQLKSVSLGWETGCGLTSNSEVACWPSRHIARQPALYSRLQTAIVPIGKLLTNPTDIVPWPNGGLAIAEKTGSIIVLTSEFDTDHVLDLTATVASDGAGEKGLLSVAVDPQVEGHNYIYVYYTLHVGDDPATAFGRLSRFSVVNESIARESELTILDIHRDTNSKVHWGGAIRFGPDHMLYLGIGDSSCLDCPQDPGSLHGKIIRIDVSEASTEQPYRIPEDNPFIDVPGARAEVWAIGMRNPWRMAFDSQDGSLWVGDVGATFEEEVSIVTSGANLGWPILEGFLCKSIDKLVNLTEFALEGHQTYNDHPCADIEHLSAPIISYITRRTGNCAVIGGVVYRGSSVPWLNGTYLFGDFCSGRVWALRRDENVGWEMVQIADLDHLITSFGVDENGELLILTFGGNILQLTEADAGFAPSVTHVPLWTTVTDPSLADAAPIP